MDVQFRVSVFSGVDVGDSSPSLSQNCLFSDDVLSVSLRPLRLNPRLNYDCVVNLNLKTKS